MLLGAAGSLLEQMDLSRGRGARGDLVAAVVRPWGGAGAVDEDSARYASDPAGGSWLVLSGRPLWTGAGPGDGPAPDAATLLGRLTTGGLTALAEIDGAFALAWFDGRRRRLHLVRDRFGIEPLFVAELGSSVLFATRLRDLRASGLLPGGLDGEGLAEFLTWCWVPGEATLDRGVRQLPAGSRLEIEPGRGVVRRERWYRLSFADPLPPDEAAIAAGFRERLEAAVVRRLGPPPFGVFISGGMDSSAVLTFARRHEPAAILTFAFRCGGGGAFDESAYARALAEALGTEHTEVVYGEAEALEKQAIVAEMEVPFCDVGINVGTWLLGRAAAGRVGFVLTGDGGDELWASHPVYAAERLLAPVERLGMPRVLHHALAGAAAWLPDSDQKRDLRVKLKRFLPDAGLPRALGHARWRAYWTPAGLAELLTPEAAALVRDHDPFRPVLAAYEGYDGPDDGLSPHLYNDYQTASGYYFSRLGLLRHFGLEPRLPFYDRALVEFGARIPARLKLEGVERTKRLFRRAMDGILPEVISRRRDKLGHSVPLKNWLRQEGPLAAWMSRMLDPAVLRRRGLVRPEVVARLMDEHRRRRHNHAHRLWALAVLEAWLQAHGS